NDLNKNLNTDQTPASEQPAVDLSAARIAEQPASESRAIAEEARKSVEVPAAPEQAPEPAPAPAQRKTTHIEIAEAFGRNKDEAQTISQVDEADSLVDGDFEKGRQTVDSPAWQAIRKGK